MDTVVLRLNSLNELRDAISILEAERTRKTDEIIADLAPEILAVNEEYDELTLSLRDRIHEADCYIKSRVANDLRETVRGESLMAVYSKPRVTWDGKGLTGYMVAHPEIEAFKKVGKPSVSIRKVR